MLPAAAAAAATIAAFDGGLRSQRSVAAAAGSRAELQHVLLDALEPLRLPHVPVDRMGGRVTYQILQVLIVTVTYKALDPR
jgi:hypothetical protein